MYCANYVSFESARYLIIIRIFEGNYFMKLLTFSLIFSLILPKSHKRAILFSLLLNIKQIMYVQSKTANRGFISKKKLQTNYIDQNSNLRFFPEQKYFKLKLGLTQLEFLNGFKLLFMTSIQPKIKLMAAKIISVKTKIINFIIQYVRQDTISAVPIPFM